MPKIHSGSSSQYFNSGIVEYISSSSETITGDTITWNSTEDMTFNSTDPISFHGVEGV